MKKAIFEGSGVAIVTPMNSDGTVNYKVFDELIEFHIKNKTDAIVVCGTTGESPTLEYKEHCELIRHCVKSVAKRIPVIAGTGSNDTKHALELSLEAQKAGVDAILSVTPYYNKASQSGLIKHYTYIADGIDLPIILYNVPSRTGCNIKPETYFELSKHPNIVGIKEANGDVSSVLKTISLCRDNIVIYSGNDEQSIPIMALGGKGVISVFANICPDIMHDICYKYLNGYIKESLEIQKKYYKLLSTLFLDINPIPVKEAVNLLGFKCGKCRLPLDTLNMDKLDILKNIMKEYNLI